VRGGIIEGAKDGKGRGRQVISAARTCNLIVVVLDALKPLTHKRLIEHELEAGMGDTAFYFGSPRHHFGVPRHHIGVP